jgi:hypothetical protein
MKGKYRSIFIIPSSARRVLGDTGWKFLSPDRISRKIVDALMTDLALVKSDAYLGMEEFSGENAKAIVSLDEQGQVEHIHIRAYADRDIEGELRSALTTLGAFTDIEAFSP